mgnify:CR=1 FL=1
MAILEVKGLCKNFGKTEVLKGIDFELEQAKGAIKAICTVKVEGKTGVEMEALHGVSAALLTIYDMCKAIDREMVINEIRLTEKTGGKSDFFND